MNWKKPLLTISIIFNIIICILTWILVFDHFKINSLGFLIMIITFAIFFLFNFICGILQTLYYIKDKINNMNYLNSGINIIFNIFVPVGVGFSIFLLISENKNK